MSTETITRCDACREPIMRSGYRVQSRNGDSHDVHAKCLSADIDGRVLSGVEPAVVVSRFDVESRRAA